MSLDRLVVDVATQEEKQEEKEEREEEKEEEEKGEGEKKRKMRSIFCKTFSKQPAMDIDWVRS